MYATSRRFTCKFNYCHVYNDMGMHVCTCSCVPFLDGTPDWAQRVAIADAEWALQLSTVRCPECRSLLSNADVLMGESYCSDCYWHINQ